MGAGEWPAQGLVPDLEGQRVIKYRNVFQTQVFPTVTVEGINASDGHPKHWAWWYSDGELWISDLKGL